MMKSPKTTYHHASKTILLFVLMCLLSCANKKNIFTEQLISEKNSKLLFLNYTLSKNNKNQKSIIFINKIITQGRVKNNNLNYTNTPSIGDIKCSQLNKNSIELSTVFIKNPLVKVVEALNDSLSFSMQKFDQNNTPITLKLQLHPQSKFISLSHITDSLLNSIELIKTKLD